MSPPVDRRTTLKWMLSAAATLPVLSMAGCDSEPVTRGDAAASGDPWTAPPDVTADGYGKDPDLLKDYKPGDTWPLTFGQAQRATATALSALILPADEDGPGAVEVGVVDFIDEWISSPYPDSVRDKPIILDGLAWMDTESKKRFKKDFAKLSDTQRVAICDDISAKEPKPEFTQAAAFFNKYRSLTAGGFFTTPVGMKDLGYVGNVALTSYDGPPPEVRKKLGLA